MGEHVAELRSRLLQVLLALCFFSVLGIYFAQELLSFLSLPLKAALATKEAALYFTGPLDMFTVQLKLGFFTGLALSAPLAIYHFWRFVMPALHPMEKSYFRSYVLCSCAFFFLGLFFAYFLVLPWSLGFLLSLAGNVARPLITLNDYLSLLGFLLFGFSLVFQLPLLLFMLAILGVISASALAKLRRVALLCSLILGALLTPPDPISQLALALPLYAMYEGTLLLLRLVKG